MTRQSLKARHAFFIWDIASYRIYRKFEGSSLTIERQTIHVSDDTGRIAMLEKRTIDNAADDNNTEATLVRYIYSNHLQSASLGQPLSYPGRHYRRTSPGVGPVDLRIQSMAIYFL